ncbi:MAG: hypothetical protein WC990_06965 [Sphaerochaetaceae bacterium]
MRNNNIFKFIPAISKKNLISKIVFTLFLLTLLVPLFADTIPVRVIANTEDTVGKSLASNFRHLIRTSSAYHQTYSTDGIHFVIRLDTLDKNKGQYGMEGFSTIYSYIILIEAGDGFQLFLTNGLGYSGSLIAHKTAQDIYNYLDDYIETLLQLLNY